jgi:hypothetical protein
MNLRVIYQDEPRLPEPWTAYDEDAFDGAPDGGPQPLGTGKTKEEAIQDLLRQLTEEDEPC